MLREQVRLSTLLALLSGTSLAAASGTDPCACIGATHPDAASFSPRLPGDYGSMCAAHDKATCEEWWGSSFGVGAWCCDSWCYVDSACPGATKNDAGLWYSYEHCADEGGECPYTQAPTYQLADDKYCTPWHEDGATVTGTTAELCKDACSANASCLAANWFPMYGDKCYLFNDCSNLTDSKEGGEVYFKQEATVDSCACIGATHPDAASFSPMLPRDYGSMCAAHDKTTCKEWWGSSLGVDAWCCASWCYVDSACPGATLNDAGLWYSYDHCANEGGECPYTPITAKCGKVKADVVAHLMTKGLMPVSCTTAE